MPAVHAQFDVPARPDAFMAALEGLTRVNEGLMREASLAGSGFPPLYKAGVRYRREPEEMWRHIGTVYMEGWGDCEDLSAWRAAELRVSGEDPRASVAVYRSAPKTYHAVVRRGDGSIEDPSKKLGMRPRLKKGDAVKPEVQVETATVRQVEGLIDCIGEYGLDGDGYEGIGIGADPSPDMKELSFELVRIPGEPVRGLFGSRETTRGWTGVVRIPLTTGKAVFASSEVVPVTSAMMSVPGAPGVKLDPKAQAVNSALSLATKALSAGKALLPPQAALALTALQSAPVRAAVSTAAKAGKALFKGAKGIFKKKK